MICPRCKDTLVKEKFENEVIDVCRSCGGMWLHKHQLDNLLSETEGDVEKCSIDSEPRGDFHNVIMCRECKNQPMKKISFLEYSDIIMDYCPKCGSFWLDKDELKEMHKYIEQVDKGSHEVINFSAYNILVRLSRIAHSIFH